jgi:TonB family protein
MRRAPARFRYRLWAAAGALAILLPAISILPITGRWSFFRTAYPIAFRSDAAGGVHSAFVFSMAAIAPFWMRLLLWSYLVFLSYRGYRFFRAWSQTRRLAQSGLANEISSSLTSIIERCRSAFNLESVAVHYSPRIQGPVTVGVWKPAILVPAAFMETEAEDEWLAMLSHEMAHVQRKDFVKNLIGELLYIPISFHPAAGLIKARLAAARETACDELATERCIEPDRYADSLLAIARKVSRLPESASYDHSLGIFDANMLEERVMKLLRNQTLSVFWSRVALALVLLALTGVCVHASAYAVRIGDGAASSQPGTKAQVPQLEAGVTPPRAISTPDPIYPKAAKKEGRQGDVRLWCVIGTDGSVRDARVEKSLSPDFDESAINAVQQWTFEPATKDGQPVEVKISVEVTFKLYNK